jgi:hypothetical protein
MVVVVCICSLVERGKERRERRSKPTVVYGQEWAQEIRGEGEDDQWRDRRILKITDLSFYIGLFVSRCKHMGLEGWLLHGANDWGHNCHEGSWITMLSQLSTHFQTGV